MIMDWGLETHLKLFMCDIYDTDTVNKINEKWIGTVQLLGNILFSWNSLQRDENKFFEMIVNNQ